MQQSKLAATLVFVLTAVAGLLNSSFALGASPATFHYATDANWRSPSRVDLLDVAWAFESKGYWNLDPSRSGRIDAIGVDLIFADSYGARPGEQLNKFVLIKFGLIPIDASGNAIPTKSTIALEGGLVVHGKTPCGVPFAAYFSHHEASEVESFYRALTGSLPSRHSALLRIFGVTVPHATAADPCPRVGAAPLTAVGACTESLTGTVIAQTAASCAVKSLKALPGEAMEFFTRLLKSPSEYWNAAVSKVDSLGQALKHLDFEMQPILDAIKNLSVDAKRKLVCNVAEELAPKILLAGVGIGVARASIMIAESLAKLSQVARLLEGLSRSTPLLKGSSSATSGAAEALLHGALSCGS